MIPIIQILKEIKRAGFLIESTIYKVVCKVFEDNTGALEMSKVQNHGARTNNLNIKFHHFIEYVTRGEVTILPIGTLDKASNYLDKSANQSTLGRHCLTVHGWRVPPRTS